MKKENDWLFKSVFGEDEDEIDIPVKTDYYAIANSTKYLTEVEKNFYFSLIDRYEGF